MSSLQEHTMAGYPNSDAADQAILKDIDNLGVYIESTDKLFRTVMRQLQAFDPDCFNAKDALVSRLNNCETEFHAALNKARCSAIDASDFLLDAKRVLGQIMSNESHDITVEVEALQKRLEEPCMSAKAVQQRLNNLHSIIADFKMVVQISITSKSIKRPRGHEELDNLFQNIKDLETALTPDYLHSELLEMLETHGILGGNIAEIVSAREPTILGIIGNNDQHNKGIIDIWHSMMDDLASLEKEFNFLNPTTSRLYDRNALSDVAAKFPSLKHTIETSHDRFKVQAKHLSLYASPPLVPKNGTSDPDGHPEVEVKDPSLNKAPVDASGPFKEAFATIGEQLNALDHIEGLLSTAGLTPRWTIFNKRFDILVHRISHDVSELCEIMDVYLCKISRISNNKDSSNRIQDATIGVIKELNGKLDTNKAARVAITAGIQYLERTIFKLVVTIRNFANRRLEIVSKDLQNAKKREITLLAKIAEHSENKEEARRLKVELEEARRSTVKQTKYLEDRLDSQQTKLRKIQDDIRDFVRYIGEFYDEPYKQVLSLQNAILTRLPPGSAHSPFLMARLESMAVMIDRCKLGFDRIVDALARFA